MHIEQTQARPAEAQISQKNTQKKKSVATVPVSNDSERFVEVERSSSVRLIAGNALSVKESVNQPSGLSLAQSHSQQLLPSEKVSQQNLDESNQSEH